MAIPAAWRRGSADKYCRLSWGQVSPGLPAQFCRGPDPKSSSIRFNREEKWSAKESWSGGAEAQLNQLLRFHVFCEASQPLAEQALQLALGKGSQDSGQPLELGLYHRRHQCPLGYLLEFPDGGVGRTLSLA